MVESSVTQVSVISTPAKNAREAVERLLKLAVDLKDQEKAKLFVTKRTREGGALNIANVPPGATYTIGAEETDELGARIPVTMKSPGAAMEMTMPLVVVQEEGSWKVDMPASMERMMGGAADMMKKAMGTLGDAMGKAMAGVGEALSAGFSTGAQYAEPAAVMAEEMTGNAVASATAAVKRAAPRVVKATERVAKRTATMAKNAVAAVRNAATRSTARPAAAPQKTKAATTRSTKMASAQKTKAKGPTKKKASPTPAAKKAKPIKKKPAKKSAKAGRSKKKR